MLSQLLPAIYRYSLYFLIYAALFPCPGEIYFPDALFIIDIWHAFFLFTSPCVL